MQTISELHPSNASLLWALAAPEATVYECVSGSVCLGVCEYFEGEGREGMLQYQTKTEKIVRTQTQ